MTGSHPNDQLWAAALRRAASRFGAKIVQEPRSRIPAARGAPTAASSSSSVRSRLHPASPSYDILVAADESEVFAGYLRPGPGSATCCRLRGAGADQLGSRIRPVGRGAAAKSLYQIVRPPYDRARYASLDCGPDDRRGRLSTQSSDAKTLAAFMHSPEFELAAFKGQKLTLRDWNLQLRQPILLADGRMVVSVSPQEGYLHPTTELDTLGYDRPESKCRLK